jgi:hypothetical protein
MWSNTNSKPNQSNITMASIEGSRSAPQEQMMKLSYPKDGRLYHGVHPADDKGDESAYIDNPKVLKDYLNAAFPDTAPRRSVAWVYFSHEWEKESYWEFPWDAVRRIDKEEKSIPFIRLMLRTTYDATKKKEKFFTFERILRDRKINDALKRWGERAAEYGKPLVVEYGTEVNSEIFPWNGVYNGANKGSADKFKEVYRHIRKVIESAGAKNITWVFHVTLSDDDTPEWNTIKSYYPGPGLVDWIGISVYGPQTARELCLSFEDVMQKVMSDRNGVKSLEGGRPLFILEMGVVKDYPQDKPNAVQCEQGVWAEKALAALARNPWDLKVRGFSWWNEGWEDGGHIEMRVQANDQLKQVFQNNILKEKFVHTPVYE